MGLSDWIEKYIGCDDYLNEQSKHPLQAVIHSLNKWQGLQQKVLEQYKLKRRGKALLGTQNKPLRINDVNCSLCLYSQDLAKSKHEVYYCGYCPGAIANGKTCLGAYDDFSKTGDVEPMLKWLRKAKKHIERVS